jgi:hypothetical protein
MGKCTKRKPRNPHASSSLVGCQPELFRNKLIDNALRHGHEVGSKAAPSRTVEQSIHEVVFPRQRPNFLPASMTVNPEALSNSRYAPEFAIWESLGNRWGHP